MHIFLTQADPQAYDRERGQNAAGQISFAAGGGNSSEYRHGDGIHFIAVACGGIGTVGTGNIKQRADRSSCPHHRVDDEADLLYMDSGIMCRQTIGADSVHAASEGTLSEDDREDNADDQHQEQDDRDLSEAQIDRFLIKEKIDYPNKDEEFEILNRIEKDVFSKSDAVVELEDVYFLQQMARKVYLDDAIKRYIINIFI